MGTAAVSNHMMQIAALPQSTAASSYHKHVNSGGSSIMKQRFLPTNSDRTPGVNATGLGNVGN